MVDTFIVHMAGKTGSQTIEQTLLTSLPNVVVERHHFFSAETISELRQTCALADAIPDVSNSILSQCRNAEHCRETTISDRKRPLVVISAYRDPFRQSVSAMFQNLAVFIPDFKAEIPASHWVDQLIAQFLFVFRERKSLSRSARFLDRRRSRPVTGFIRWFETDFNLTHGVNVYDKDIDDIGTLRFDDGPRSFLIYKTESLEQNFDRIFSSIPGICKFQRVDTNRGSEKSYSELYSLFLSMFEMTEDIYEYYYNNRFYKHFYR